MKEHEHATKNKSETKPAQDEVAKKAYAIYLKEGRPQGQCCGADEPVEEARRKLHEHRATSLPVVDKAGGCCGTVSAHRLEKS